MRIVDSLRTTHSPLPLFADVLYCILLSYSSSPLSLTLILFFSYDQKQQIFITFPRVPN